MLYIYSSGSRGGADRRCTALRVRFSMASLQFYIALTLPASQYHWGRLSLQQKSRKGKGLPPQAWTGPRNSRYFKAPDFLDVRHYKGGRSSALHTGHLYPRRNLCYSFLEVESKQKPVPRIFHVDKERRCVGLTALPLLSAEFLET